MDEFIMACAESIAIGLNLGPASIKTGFFDQAPGHRLRWVALDGAGFCYANREYVVELIDGSLLFGAYLDGPSRLEVVKMFELADPASTPEALATKIVETIKEATHVA